MGEIYKAAPLSREQIANIAHMVRKLLGIDDDVYYVNIMKVVEITLKKLIPQFDIIVIPDENMSAMAVTYPDEDIMIIKESVYNGAVKGNGRDRFTLAHELAHYILHNDVSICFARGSEEVKVYENPEWQADVFAGEFLMLRKLIYNENPEYISVKCGVSRKAANYQHKKIRRI